MAKRRNAPSRSTLQINRQAILDLLSAPDYQPLKRDQLRRALSIPKFADDAFSLTLQELEEAGQIVQLKRKGYALAQSADLVRGTIDFHRAGSAVVRAADGSREVFIPAQATGTALPGDRVMVRISSTRERGPGRTSLEGAVIRVLEREKLTIVGTLKKQSRIFYVKPMQASITHDIVVPDPQGAQVGDRVLVKLAAWDEPNVSPEGEIVEVIGPADDASLDTLAVCRSYNLPDAFSPAAIAEAEGLDIGEKDLAGRLDLRKKFIFTIDPATARDFDDAISLESAGAGEWRLGVHIADVSHFIPVGSALDKEAIARGTSVYFPDRVVPMLPEQLSNGLCSLKPNTDRLAFSAILTIDDQGEVKRARFAPSVIHSRLRLTYEQALAALETKDGAAYSPAGMGKAAVDKLKQVHRLAQAMRRRRMAEGALHMGMPEVRFILGADGRIERVEPVENDISHQLIEECMLAANEAVCRELSRRQIPLLHRIHEPPDPEKLADLAENFLVFGWHVGDLSQRQNLTRLLHMIDDLPEPEAWFSVVLRSLKRAQYSAERIGHFGLAKEYYTHFTSPIRRYPDLIIHRILREVLATGRAPYPKKALQELAMHCSDRENVATEAERELVDLKKLRFFSEQLESGNVETYAGVAMDVRNFGFFVHIHQVQAYGLVHVSQLADDFYDFNPIGLELKGRRNGQTYRVGDTVKVTIAKVDLERRQLDFQLATPPPRNDRSSRREGRRRRR